MAGSISGISEQMNAIVKTNIFKSGNSVAVRLPKGFGFKEGDAVELGRNGRKVEISPVYDPEYERAQLAALRNRLHALGPVVGGDPQDGRIEFPDRPGLY